MSTASREYLRAYARGQHMSEPPRRDDETVEQYAQRVGADPNAPTEPAPAPTAAPEDADTPEDAPAPASSGNQRRGSFLDRLSGTVASKPRPPTSLQDRVANLPTPGGAGAMLLILLAMIFFIIPVSAGYTRAQLLWLTFLGKTTLPSTATPAGATPASGSSGSIPVISGLQQFTPLSSAQQAGLQIVGNGLAQAGVNQITTGNPFGITLPPLPGSSQPIQLPATFP